MSKLQRGLWTVEDLRVVKNLHAVKSAIEIAAILQRPASAVYRAAKVLGLPSKAAPRKAFDVRKAIKRLHSQHKDDQQIADELGLDRRYVNTLRRGQGLKVHADLILESRRRGIKTQYARLGIKNPAELRERAFKRYAREHGLPEDTRFRAVQVAYCLARHGPSTRRQICDRLGLKWHSVRKNGLCANGNWVKRRIKRDQKGTYLSELMHTGIVVKMERALQTGRRSGNVSLYDLTPEWRERITAHVQQKQLTAGAHGPAA